MMPMTSGISSNASAGLLAEKASDQGLSDAGARQESIVSSSKYIPHAWFWVLVAVIPYWTPHIIDCAVQDGRLRGFLFYDMPYYSANGRAVFERGNGFLGPNPYDPSPTAPNIYFHWLTWLLGAVIVTTGIDPGVLFLGLGVVAGMAASRITWELVRALLKTDRFIAPVFLLAMWGGGLLVLFGAVKFLFSGESLLRMTPMNLLDVDPFSGEWCLYWGRTFIYPTEAVYHALTGSAWLCAIRGRRYAAIALCGALCATHPFSGLALLLTLGLWWCIRFAMKTSATLVEVVLLGVLMVAFFGYYFVFLDSFPEHRALRVTWQIPWNTPLIAQIAAYAPVSFLAFYSLLVPPKDLPEWPRISSLLCSSAFVSFVLSNHHWIMTPNQPLHFTRGLVWMPLFLLSVSTIERLLESIRRPALIAITCLLAFSVDNAAFVYNARLIARENSRITGEEWDALMFLRAHQTRGLLVSDNRQISYLCATYTHNIPYFGHVFNTPHYDLRFRRVSEWIASGFENDTSFDAAQTLVLSQSATARVLSRSNSAFLDWKILFSNDGFVVFERK